MREEENDLLVDVSFDNENEADDNENFVATDLRQETLKIEVKSEILANEETSKNNESDNQAKNTRSVTINL